jgi:Domain of unknown function (DUF5666)
MRWKTFGIAALVAVLVPVAAGAAVHPNIEAFGGSVASATSTSLTVDVIWPGRRGTTAPTSSTVTVAIDSSTKVSYGKTKSSIEPGDLVGVVATGSDGALTARRIRVTCNCHFVAGTVGTVSSSSLQVLVTRTGPVDTVLNGKTVTIALNSSTQYKNSSTLTSGEKVRVVFSASGFFKDPSFDPETATFTALRVATSKS